MLKLLLLASLLFTTMTPSPVPPAVSAGNILDLQPALTVDFAPEVGTIDSGWFTMSPDGEFIAVVQREGGMVVYTARGQLADDYVVESNTENPATVLDASFNPDSDQLATVHTADGETYIVAVRSLYFKETNILEYDSTYGRPVRIWMDADDNVWLETAPTDPESGYQVVRLAANETEPAMVIPSAPEAAGNTEAYVRIGRIPAPLAITSTPEGLVRLWDLETGEITSEVQLDIAPVFGRVNETTGTQMAWRDPESLTLQLLDFATGENVKIADLAGEYIQALLISPEADVVLGVHIGDDPVVVAWEVETGERYDLGRYRSDCTRVPDMVQLSRDGRALVIGCDVGLEIWKVQP